MNKPSNAIKADVVYEKTDFDVLIVGAGISGIGMAWNLDQNFPNKSWLILEKRDNFGGTWDFHKYPGVRSDSDFFTFGFAFKPWTGSRLADAPRIMKYLGEVVQDNDFNSKTRYGKQVKSANWSTENQKWYLEVETLETGETVTYTCNFLNMCQGYYDFDNPFQPTWDGMDDFEGEIVHPMRWDPNYKPEGKNIAVIGSGATAATMVPKLAAKAKNVTMIQRSPTYFFPGSNEVKIANIMRFLRLPQSWIHKMTRSFVLSFERGIHRSAVRNPEKMKKRILKEIGKHVSKQDLEKHFTPSYRPWQQRLAFIPDGDLFEALGAGKVTVETDTIDRFTPQGVLLSSGTEVKADTIVTATGFNLLFLGGISFSVDGKSVDPGDCFTHRGIMMENLPNLLYVFGYLRTSWTMRVGLLADYQTRLFNHMEENGYTSCTPTRLPQQMRLLKGPLLDEEEFNPGYMKRGMHLMPKNAGEYPWTVSPDYFVERKKIVKYDLTDPTMVYK